MKKYDVVYILKEDVKPDELTYSLRSLEKNFEHGKVWFYCGKPGTITPDEYVPQRQEGASKWERARSSLFQICKNEKITEKFWLFNDDFFITKPWTSETPLNRGELRDHIEKVERRHGDHQTSYTRQLRNCEGRLKAAGLTTYDYALHCPILIDRAAMLETLEAFPDCPMFRSLYGNYANIGGEYSEDHKIITAGTQPDKEAPFLSTSEGTFNGPVLEYLEELFPDPCKYERTPKISVIIPYKNAGGFIGGCLRSVTEQKGNFEFLFVNDHSSDNGNELVTAAAEQDPRIIPLENVHHTGVSGARNTGLDNASGDYITFLDADDELIDNAYKSYCEATSKAAVNIIQFNHLRFYPTKNKTVLKYANAEGEYSASKLPQCWPMVWNKIYKTDFLNDLRFDERLQYGEDGMFILNCLAKENQIHHAARDLVTVKHIFQNPRSLIRVKADTDIFKYFRELESFVKKQRDPELRRAVCSILSDYWGAPYNVDVICNG